MNEYPPLRTPIDINRAPAFHEMNEHPKRFERMSVAALELDPRFKHATLFGVGGERQYGVDGLAEPLTDAGGSVAMSAKCYERTDPPTLVKWSDQFLHHHKSIWKDKNVRFFVLTTAAINITSVKNITQIRKEKLRFLKLGIEYEVWGPEQLYNRIRTSRSAVRRFLGEIWHQIIFGPDVVGDDRQTRPIQLFEPRTPAHYRNRDREIAQVFDAFRIGKWCGLYGIGGAGKSSTAARIANQIRTNDGRAVIWLSAREMIDSTALLESLANAFGYSLRSLPNREQKIAHLRAITEKRNALIVFDNLTSAEQSETLLSSVGTGNDVIVTARIEERSLSAKFAIVPIVIGELPTLDAALILIQLIGHDVSRKALSEWEFLATKIGNFPLGLEIVAGDYRSSGIKDPLQYANERVRTSKWAFREPSMDRLRSELTDSLEKLGSRFLLAFEALGVFEGSLINPDAITSVCNFESSDERDDFIQNLQQRMFARVRDDGRLSIHPIVIETARLRSSGRGQPELDQHEAAVARHIRHYHSILSKNGGYEWNLKNFPNLIAHELEIVRAIDAAARLWLMNERGGRNRYRDLCVEMTVLISWYLHWRGLWDLRVRLCKRVTDGAERDEGRSTRFNKNQIGNLYVDRGWIHLHQKDLDAAQICADSGGRWLKGSGDEIFARELSGQIAFARSDYQFSRRIFAALRAAVPTNSRSWFVFSFRFFDVLLAAGEQEHADGLLSSLVELIQQPKLVQNEIIEDVYGRILYRVSLRHLTRGEDELALATLRQAVSKFEDSGIVAPERAAAGIELACLLAKQKKIRECAKELATYLAQARALGDFDLAARGEKLLRKSRSQAKPRLVKRR